MDDELKSAVRRVRGLVDGSGWDDTIEVYLQEYPHYSEVDEDEIADEVSADLEKVAEAYLAEHLPDDDAPASPARYEGKDGVDVVIHSDGTAEIERVEELTACIGLPGVYRTRGDVRRLLRGLQMGGKV